jgi:hypothetical protein
LRALKRRQREEHKTLGQLVSELLAQSLAATPRPNVNIRWATADLRPRLDLDDKDAVWAVLDREPPDDDAGASRRKSRATEA